MNRDKVLGEVFIEAACLVGSNSTLPHQIEKEVLLSIKDLPIDRESSRGIREKCDLHCRQSHGSPFLCSEFGSHCRGCPHEQHEDVGDSFSCPQCGWSKQDACEAAGDVCIHPVIEQAVWSVCSLRHGLFSYECEAIKEEAMDLLSHCRLSPYKNDDSEWLSIETAKAIQALTELGEKHLKSSQWAQSPITSLYGPS